MNTTRAYGALLAALTVAACGSTTVQSGFNAPIDVPAADGSPDVSVIDGGAIDGATTPDATSPDLPLAPDDTPVDLPPSPDGAVVVDRPAVNDVTTPTDASAFSLRGAWRVVRYEFREMGTGRLVTVTDHNTMYTDPASMMTSAVRVNGMLYLEPTHLSSSFGILANDHFYAFLATGTAEAGYSAGGAGAPGLLDEARSEFQPTGSTTPLSITRNADGTISFTDATSGNRSTFERARDAGPGLTSINTVGVAMAYLATVDAAHPRLALLWDLPGVNRWTESNGVALHFAGRFGSYPLVIAGAPPGDVVAAWMGSSVAVAHVVAYDDANNNSRYDAAADALLGVSPVAITWRAATAFTAPDGGHFALRYVGDGLHYGDVHLDGALGRFDVVPFDNTVPASPDIPIRRPDVAMIPDLL